MLKVGQAAETEITGYTSEGDGVCRIDGCAVFVPNAIRGERCEIKLTHVGQHSAHGKIKRILSPSPHRIPRDCPYAKQCGGCQFRHMDYAAECEAKALRVADAMERIGGQTGLSVPILGAETVENYRNKAQYQLALQKGVPVAGFYQKGSHAVVAIERCRILPPLCDRAAQTVLRWAREAHVSIYNETTHKGLLRNVFVRVGFRSRQVMVCIVANGGTLPQQARLLQLLREALPGLCSVVLSVNQRPGNTILGDKFITLYGKGYLEDTLCGLRFRLSPRSFYQVNPAQAERLYEKAVALADLHGEETVLDLYCGTGTITLALARRAKKAIGVEIIPQAIADAKDNARRNGIANAEFYCADAAEAAQRFADANTRPDVIVVDPPRKGLAPDVIEAIAAMSPQRVVYVSCDPATLARDVKLLSAHGYALQTAEAVDMFPRTAHVETVVLLSRK